MMYKVTSFFCVMLSPNMMKLKNLKSQEVQVSSTGLFGQELFLSTCFSSPYDLPDMKGFGLISCETAAQNHSRNTQQSVPPTLTYKGTPQF